MSRRRSNPGPGPQLPMPGLDPIPPPRRSSRAQPEKPWARRRVEAIIREKLPNREVEISWTGNLRRLFSADVQKDGSCIFRLSRIFEQAPRGVLEAAAGLVVRRTDRRRQTVRQFIESYHHLAEQAVKRNPRIVTRGAQYDLAEVMQIVREGYFADADIPARITWGARRGTQGRRRISLGSYSQATQVIRIHPALDNPEVPLYYLTYIVMHEMVHAKLKARTIRGRRCFHDEEFYRELGRYSLIDKAEAWEEEHLIETLTRWRP